jgi:hypothetical protein
MYCGGDAELDLSSSRYARHNDLNKYLHIVSHLAFEISYASTSESFKLKNPLSHIPVQSSFSQDARFHDHGGSGICRLPLCQCCSYRQSGA